MHPLTPLLPEEITTCADVLSKNFQLPAGKKFHFKAISLQEPPKAELVAWSSGEGPKPPRLGCAIFYIRGTDQIYEVQINISTRTLCSRTLLPAGFHGPADGPEILAMEALALSDEGVQRELKKLELPEDTVVVVDPWPYGSDGDNDERRMYQCFLYLRDKGCPDSNHYAAPLSISPVVDVQTMEVVRIFNLPTGNDATPTPPRKYVRQKAAEYTPEHQKLRTDLKPLHVVQPEGASFTVAEEVEGSGGAVVQWQKWSIRTSFNWREGLVLHGVEYDGRSLFYRISLSEMNIPYGDPRTPYHRKAAFDLGDAGAGIMANNLKLGCDCLGSIYYISSTISTDTGSPLPMPNVICIHEQDGGIGFKHTNYRTGRAVVTRSRELVLQTIITVSNYEYILAYIFTQAGDLTYEVRATGMLSTTPMDPELTTSPYGTVVHPGVLAQNHQHIFSLRIDPSLDAGPNRIVYDETHALPVSPTNPHGVAYAVTSTPITTSSAHNTNPDTSRTFKIQHTSARNPINNLPISYKLQVPPYQKMLSAPSSFNYQRASFASHAVFVTKYREDELFAGGKWTNQSRGGGGVREWAEREEGVEEDPVLWVQFGINHVPRIEDWPIMPCETMRVGLRPVNFFTANPAQDVPPSEQGVNKSVLLNGTAGVVQNGVEAVVGKEGTVEEVKVNGVVHNGVEGLVGKEGTVGEVRVNGCCSEGGEGR